MKAILGLMGVLWASAGQAQTLKLPESLHRLGQEAEETVLVTMDRSLLDFASRVLSDRNPDHVEAKRVLQKLTSFHVNQFSFDRSNAYKRKLLQDVRSQVSGPGWSRVVEVRSRRQEEDVDVFMKSQGNQIEGMVVIVAEPRELTIVDLVGSLRPEDLADLRGVAGIPKWELTGGSR